LHAADRPARLIHNHAGGFFLKPIFTLVAATALVAAMALSFTPAHAADLAEAKQNYDAVCAACHGTTGNADGPGAATLSTPPRKFSDCAVMSKISDDTMIDVIKNGGGAAHLSAEMQPWGSAFSDDQIKSLVAYIRTFCKK
jgi:mono/diheme cytochrome c family protein